MHYIMKIIINGKEKEIQDNIPLETLINNISKIPARVIAELNGNIIKKDVWHKIILSEDDNVELVTFVGGG